MQKSATYTITYNIQNVELEVHTQDIEFALWLSVEKKNVFKLENIHIEELLQQYATLAHSSYLQDIENILLLEQATSFAKPKVLGRSITRTFLQTLKTVGHVGLKIKDKEV